MKSKCDFKNIFIDTEEEKNYHINEGKIYENSNFIFYKIIDKRTNKCMCKKVLKNVNRQSFSQISLKIEFLHTIYHPCIEKLICVNISEPIENSNKNDEELSTTIALFTEFLELDLNEIIKKGINNTLKAKIVLEIVHAVNFLHKHHFILKNLNSSNIMFNSSYETKLIGLINEIDEDDQYAFETKGIATLSYLSPEIIMEEVYDQKVDVYSFGAILYYIFTERIPKLSLREICNGKPIPLPKPSDSISSFCIELIKLCINFEPSKRPSFEEILNKIRENEYNLASDIDQSILIKRDSELENPTMNDFSQFSNEFEYKIIQMINQNDYYQTFLVEDKNTKNKLYANIFHQNIKDYPTNSKIKAYEMIKKILLLNHPLIIRSIKFNENHYSTLFTEYNNDDSLQFIIKNGGINSKGLEMNDTRKLINLYGIASAMSYLHSKKILHYDLNPLNIIEDEFFRPKLINYGLKTVFPSFKDLLRIKEFSFYYAPEYYINNEYSKSSEVYSFGLIAYEILTCRNLFEGVTFNDHLINIHNEHRFPYNSAIPIFLWKLIEKCLSQNPTERPTFDEIVNELSNDQKIISKNINIKKYMIFIKSMKLTQDGQNSTNNDETVDEPEKKKTKKSQKSKKGKKHHHKRKRYIYNDDDDDNDEEEEEEENKDENKDANTFENDEMNEIIKKLAEENVNKIELKNYKQGNEIGRGGYGIVYEAFKKNKSIKKENENETFAAKVFFLTIFNRKISDPFVISFLNETIHHSKLLHPSIVKFIGYNPHNFNLDPFKPTIMMKYINNGSLENYITKSNIDENDDKIHCLNDTQKLIIIYGIASGMKYLHSLNIIHRDLKPLNIFIDENLFPKIADFGLSINANEKSENIIGTSAFIAPEIWDSNDYSKASDVYAFSIVVYELMTGEFLFENYNSSQICYKIAFEKFRPKIDSSVPETYRKLIESCWADDKKDRPSFEEILNDLRTNENFINEKVDRNKYHAYIRTIDQNF